MPPGSHQPHRSQNARKLKKKTFTTDADGWTHVARNGPPAPAPTASDLARGLHTLNLNDGSNSTSDQIASTQKRYDRIWRSSESWSRLSALLHNSVLLSPTDTDTTTPAPPINLTKCICLGLGSLSGTRDAPRFELAALHTILEILQPQHPSIIHNLVFQDPAFTPADTAFLTEQGHRVLTSPAAFTEIDATTFLFAPHLEHDVLAMALQHGRGTPGMCIANGDLVPDNSHRGISAAGAAITDPTMTTLAAFTAAMQARPLPEFDRDPWCHFTWLYWRSREGSVEHEKGRGPF